jgi:hypothetical protein
LLGGISPFFFSFLFCQKISHIPKSRENGITITKPDKFIEQLQKLSMHGQRCITYTPTGTFQLPFFSFLFGFLKQRTKMWPSWPGTCNPPATASQVLELQV